MIKHFSAAVFCLATNSSMSFAQSVAMTGHTTGRVLVNHGKGFVQAPRGTRLASGDIVFVKRGGRVDVKYENGCTRTVNPGRVHTVDQAGCRAGQQAVTSASGTPLLGGLLLGGVGVGAALALGATQDFGAPGGGGDRHPNPVSR